MGIWVELGIFGLALAFGLWQLWDVKQAREQSRRARATAPGTAQASGAAPAPSAPGADQPPAP